MLMAPLDNQIQRNYNRHQNEAPFFPFSPIACLIVLATLSGAACGWLTRRKRRSQVTAAPPKDTLVMAAKHGIAGCVSLVKRPERSVYSSRDARSAVASIGFEMGDVTDTLPAILVTPPSPPKSDASIGSCGDLLLVYDADSDERDNDDDGDNDNENCGFVGRRARGSGGRGSSYGSSDVVNKEGSDVSLNYLRGSIEGTSDSSVTRHSHCANSDKTVGGQKICDNETSSCNRFSSPESKSESRYNGGSYTEFNSDSQVVNIGGSTILNESNNNNNNNNNIKDNESDSRESAASSCSPKGYKGTGLDSSILSSISSNSNNDTAGVERNGTTQTVSESRADARRTRPGLESAKNNENSRLGEHSDRNHSKPNNNNNNSKNNNISNNNSSSSSSNNDNNKAFENVECSTQSRKMDSRLKLDPVSTAELDHFPDYTDVFPVDEIPLAEPSEKAGSTAHRKLDACNLKPVELTHASRHLSGRLSPNGFSGSRNVGGTDVHFLQVYDARNKCFLKPNHRPPPHRLPELGQYHSNTHHHHYQQQHQQQHLTPHHYQLQQHLQHHNDHHHHHHHPHPHYHHHQQQQHLQQHCNGSSVIREVSPKTHPHPSSPQLQVSSPLPPLSSPLHPQQHQYKSEGLSLPLSDTTTTTPTTTSPSRHHGDPSNYSPSAPKPTIIVEQEHSRNNISLDWSDEEDEQEQLELSSPRPRLSSMEPGTRKTDFKFKRPKKS